jgi:hypothetical protein
MQIAATIRTAVQIGPEDYEMHSKTFIFSSKDTIEYMLVATGVTDVCDLHLSQVAADSEYKK